jgi:acyl-CoA thioester hydrolase
MNDDQTESLLKKSHSGWFDHKTHHYPLRVYYGDTDAAGIVYYANYLSFAEKARTEMMRLIGYDHAKQAIDKKEYFAVKQCKIDYLKSAILDDEIDICSELVHIGGASIRMSQTIRCQSESLAELMIILVFVSKKTGVTRIGADLRNRLNFFLV